MQLKFFVAVLCSIPMLCHAQDSLSLYNKLYHLPDKFFGSVNHKAAKFQLQIARAEEKYLKKLEKQELKMQRKLAKKDSTKAKELFGDVSSKYAQLKQSANEGQGTATVYSGKLDSLRTTMKFVQQLKGESASPAQLKQMTGIIQQYNTIGQRLNQGNQIGNRLREQERGLREKMQQLGMMKTYKKFQQQVYYYREKMDEYKNLLNNPSELESKALSLVNRLPAFQKFFNKYSEYAGLFRLPQYDDNYQNTVNGLQTQQGLMQYMQQRFGQTPVIRQGVQNNIMDAQGQLSALKDKLSHRSSISGDEEMPDFKPNAQKSKGFWKRLELGTNFQSNKSNYFLPTSTDIGLSVGYKMNERSVVGIGASYRVGWGKDIRHIDISHEGMGLRSFVDVKLKGSFWITGGGELNYRSSFKDFDILKDFGPWQQSVLLGISKKMALKKMKANCQVLYDFLHARRIPQSQPVIFRIGYGLK